MQSRIPELNFSGAETLFHAAEPGQGKFIDETVLTIGLLKVPYDPKALASSPGPACVGGLVVYLSPNSKEHIGTVVEYASRTSGVTLKVASFIDEVMVLHSPELPGFGAPSYLLFKPHSMNAP